MSRYIDADELMEIFKDLHWYASCNIVEDIPTADVVEVKRGKWKVCDAKPPTWWYECSVCGNAGNIEYNFCPNCGADMRGTKK